MKQFPCDHLHVSNNQKHFELDWITTCWENTTGMAVLPIWYYCVNEIRWRISNFWECIKHFALDWITTCWENTTGMAVLPIWYYCVNEIRWRISNFWECIKFSRSYTNTNSRAMFGRFCLQSYSLGRNDVKAFATYRLTTLIVRISYSYHYSCEYNRSPSQLGGCWTASQAFFLYHSQGLDSGGLHD